MKGVNPMCINAPKPPSFSRIVRVPLADLSAPPNGETKDIELPQAASTADNPTDKSDVSHNLNLHCYRLLVHQWRFKREHLHFTKMREHSFTIKKYHM